MQGVGTRGCWLSLRESGHPFAERKPTLDQAVDGFGVFGEADDFARDVGLQAELADASPPRLFVLFADRVEQLQQLQAAFPGGVVDSQAVPGLVLFHAPGAGS